MNFFEIAGQVCRTDGSQEIIDMSGYGTFYSDAYLPTASEIRKEDPTVAMIKLGKVEDGKFIHNKCSWIGHSNKVHNEAIAKYNW